MSNGNRTPANHPTRRQFNKSALTAPAVLTGVVATTQARAASERSSPNDRIGIACLGVRGRGNGVMRTFAANKDVQITHVCDVDTKVREQRIAELVKGTPHRPKGVKDYRTILEDKNVDALVVCTPDHWHALPTIHGCQAGKDVYVEKPDGHNIREGQMMVAAARKHNRCVQLGTQARSAPYMADVRKYVKDGSLGKVLYGNAWETARQGAIPRVADGPPPAGVDYNMWLGPAPKRAFNRYRYHGNWRWFYDYGAGDLGNDGVHRIDYCRIAMGIETMPHTVSCLGGKLFFDDAQDWPDTMNVSWSFGPNKNGPRKDAQGSPHPEHIITYEMRIWTRPRLHGHAEGAAVFGENGWLIMTHRGWQAFDAAGKQVKSGGDNDAQRNHVRNFLDCVRSRKWRNLNQEIYSGHVSSVMCHAGNIAWRTSKTLRFDAETERFDDVSANRYVAREARAEYALPADL